MKRPPEVGDEWKATAAWQCLIVLVMLSFTFNQALWYFYRNVPTVANLLGSVYADTVLRVFRAVWWLTVVLCFARVENLKVFINKVALHRGPDLRGWLAAWIAFAISLFVVYGVTKQWIPPPEEAQSVKLAGGLRWRLYAAAVVVLTPFYEETVMRGFLFKAFRGSYGVPTSVAVILCANTWFHWGLVAKPMSYAMVSLGALLLCLIRERTGSLWNCILFHCAYNTVATLGWRFGAALLIVVLPVCVYFARRPQPETPRLRPSSVEPPADRVT